MSPLKSAVLSFGKIQGGTAKNVICDCVTIAGTLRTADPELRDFMKRRIREVSAGVAAAFGTTIDVNITPGYAALINDPVEVERVFKVGRAMLGEKNVRLRAEPSMGGEDFSYFCQAVPGAFYHLGCASIQPAAVLHSKDFTLDECCLPIGAALQCALVFDRMEER